MTRYLLMIIFLLTIGAPGSAQLFKEKDFIHYAVKDGLSDNNVTCLQQDEWGYLWVGTDAGLNRYDGNSFKSFSTSSENLPLLSGKIARLKTFGQYQLGIISRGGLQLLNTQNFSVQNYIIADSTAFSTYRNMAWDATLLPPRSVAITTASGFYVFDTLQKLNVRHDAYEAGDLLNKRILYGRDIFCINNNEYLVYVEENKLAIYHTMEKTFREIDSSENEWKAFYSPAAPGGNLLGSKYQLNNNEFIFINTAKDIVVWYNHHLKKTVVSPLPFHCIQELNWNSKITMLDSGRFVVNCSNYGFYVFNINRQTGLVTCDAIKSLPLHEINCLFVDKEKRLWAGTPNGLLQQRLKAPLISSYSFEPSLKKSHYAESFSCGYCYKNKLYAGHYSRNTGLSILNATTMKLEKQIDFYGEDNMWNEIISIQMYYADTLWLGTNGGVLWFDTKTNHYGEVTKEIKKNIPDKIREKIKYKPDDALIINLTPPAKDGYAWIVYALRGIVGRYNITERTLQFFTANTRPALPFNKVKQVVYDAYGDVWLSGHSLARWNSRQQLFDTIFNIYGGQRKFNSNILAISADNNGSLWLHNEENSLLEYRIKDRKFLSYGRTDGLPSNVFESFSPVINNTLWMAGSTTLTAFDTRIKKSIVYDYSDGLSGYKPTSRRIYFDTGSAFFYIFCGNDLVKFPLRPPHDNYYSSNILVEQLVANGTQTIVQPADGIGFGPDKNNISLHFSVVDFEAGNGYTYAYKLNRASNWTSLGSERNLTLSGLLPGRYVVQLLATEKSGANKIKVFIFVIFPHYWQTTWFMLLAIAVVLALLYILYRTRIRQVRQKANIDKQLAQMEMKALHAQMNPHFIFNSLNSIKEMVLNQENNEASNYLSKFAQMIRITLDQSAHSFVTLRSTVDYLHRYIEMEKIRNSQFSCSITVDEQLDQDETMLPPMLIQPFIENAIWHGIIPPQNVIHIKVAFRHAGPQLICSIEDDGIGIDKSMAAKSEKGLFKNAYGIGNVRDRIGVLNEKYNLQSRIEIYDKSRLDKNATGTVVILELPIEIVNE